MASILGNNSNFILLPPNNVLVIVRACAVEFDGATITCLGGHNFTGISANLIVNRKCFDDSWIKSWHMCLYNYYNM